MAKFIGGHLKKVFQLKEILYDVPFVLWLKCNRGDAYVKSIGSGEFFKDVINISK